MYTRGATIVAGDRHALRDDAGSQRPRSGRSLRETPHGGAAPHLGSSPRVHPRVDVRIGDQSWRTGRMFGLPRISAHMGTIGAHDAYD